MFADERYLTRPTDLGLRKLSKCMWQKLPLMEDSTMKKLIALGLFLVVGITPSMASVAPIDETGDHVFTQVDSFRVVGNAHNWYALDRNSLIVWATPSKAYLLELRHPSPDLRYAFEIGLTSSLGRVSKGFDDVIVDGWRYPIRKIYQLDKAEARAMASKRRESS